MGPSLISVTVPAFNNAEFLGDAIKSVLNQTYPNFELIIVNDASPDNTDEVVKSFDDARIKYVVHQKNKGLAAARNTGIRAASGEFVALLDGDDIFHPEKLRVHVDFLEEHPDVSVTYNARFELNHSSDTVRELWRPPLTVDISDLVLGYPFAPSDMVVRRASMFDAGLFDESLRYYGEDLDINCKLALSGCKFASVDKALNYRRFHSRRRINNLRAYQEDEIKPLFRAFADPRFPEKAAHLKNRALANRFVGWSIFAYLQEDVELGREYCREAVKLDPSLLEGQPCKLLDSFLYFSVLDENIDHENLLEQILRQLPDEVNFISQQTSWAVSEGYLIRGVRALLWGRDQAGKSHFEKAAQCQAQIGWDFLQWVSAQVVSYETEFGATSAWQAMDKLYAQLHKYENQDAARKLRGYYCADAAFRAFASRKFTQVPKAVMRTFYYDPSYLLNRGMVKMFFKSLIGQAP